MLVAVRPPEFAPRRAFAALLLAADRVVLADTFAFSRQAFHNRARVWTDQGPRWLTVPRRHGGLGTPLADVEVVADGWRRRHRRTLRAAYGRAPFYEHVAPEWDAVLGTPGRLADLSCASVAFAARWLRAPAETVRASEMPGRPDALADAFEAAGGTALLTLPGSAERDAAALPGVPVRVLRLDEGRLAPDVPDLSVLDPLFREGPRAADVLRAAVTVGPLSP